MEKATASLLADLIAEGTTKYESATEFIEAMDQAFETHTIDNILAAILMLIFHSATGGDTT